jgi:hypothetical protein
VRISGLALTLSLAAAPALAAAPRNPYIDRNSCELECCHWGAWTAEKSLQLRDRPNGRIVAHIAAGETVTGLGGWSISHPVRVTAKSNLVETPVHTGDTFYVLANAGESLAWVWFRGKTYTTGWDDGGNAIDTRDEWWLNIAAPGGVRGFVLFDSQFGGIRSCT